MAKRKKVRNDKPCRQTFTDIEMKLLRLALNKGAYEGEADSAAVMFIRKLRERNVSADEFFSCNQAAAAVSKCGSMKMTFGKYRNVMIKDVPVSYLVWAFNNCVNMEAGLRNAIHTFLAEE